MTASTITDTLSLVMPFCGSTLMTRSRMSTLMTSSIMGTRKVSPESTVARYFPSRRTSPFSYCATTRAERASATRRMKEKIRSRANRKTFISLPHLKGDAVHAGHRDLGPFFDRVRGPRSEHRPPFLVLHADPARVVRDDPGQNQAPGAQHGVGVAVDSLHLEHRTDVTPAHQDVDC